VDDHQPEFDFGDLKGDLEAIVEIFDIPGLSFERSGPSFLDPGNSGRMRSHTVEFAILGKVAQDLVGEYKLRQDVWVAEIDFERLLSFSLRSRKFQPISKFPAVERDFSMVVPDHLTYETISSAIRGLFRDEICGFRPTDRFRGGNIAPHHYALLLGVTFQSQTHTLTSEEISELSQKLLNALGALGAHLRS
jgi:phenylalanyl-tRNA synthetase beta chain